MKGEFCWNFQGAAFEKGIKFYWKPPWNAHQIILYTKRLFCTQKTILYTKTNNFIPYIIIDFPLQQYDSLNDTHSK